MTISSPMIKSQSYYYCPNSFLDMTTQERLTHWQHVQLNTHVQMNYHWNHKHTKHNKIQQYEWSHTNKAIQPIAATILHLLKGVT